MKFVKALDARKSTNGTIRAKIIKMAKDGLHRNQYNCENTTAYDCS